MQDICGYCYQCEGTLAVKIMSTYIRIELIYNSCQVNIQLRTCYPRYVYARSRSHIFAYNCAYILNSETTVYITSIFNRPVGVPVQRLPVCPMYFVLKSGHVTWYTPHFLNLVWL